MRILVTHQIQFVEKATKILVLKEGQCLAYGTFEQIQEKDIDFMSLLAEGEEDNKKENLANVKERTLSELSENENCEIMEEEQVICGCCKD